MVRIIALAVMGLLLCGWGNTPKGDEPGVVPHWKVDDLRPGMRGHGFTVMQGTKLERFTVTILGVLKNNIGPGQDMILCRVADLNLEHTGIIAGMSGSPVYIDGKLVGAVAYAFPFGKDPIGGITPFAEMIDYGKPRQTGARVVSRTSAATSPVWLYEPQPVPAVADSLRGETKLPVARVSVAGGRDAMLAPITSPVACSGVTPQAMAELARFLEPMGMVPVQGGAATKAVKAETRGTKLEPGGAMGVSLVTGDVSMTAVGTVTAVMGDRVYGFGHPFFGMGSCQMALAPAYIHGVIPRQSVSMKMGAALDNVGSIDADVSTCVAGWIGRSADMIPLTMKVKNLDTGFDRVFQCQMAREPTMLGQLALTSLISCVGHDGQPAPELTIRIRAKISMEGYPDLVFDDEFSGPQYSGPRGLAQAYLPLGNLLTSLSNNTFHRPRLLAVECATELVGKRRLARIANAEVLRGQLKAGETLRVRVTLENENADLAGTVERQSVLLELPLPENLPPASYAAQVVDALGDLRAEFQNRRHLMEPKSFSQLYETLALQLHARRGNVALRFDPPALGLAVDGQELPDLPPGYADILGGDGSRPIQLMRRALVARQRADGVVEGARQVKFDVVAKRDVFE